MLLYTDKKTSTPTFPVSVKRARSSKPPSVDEIIIIAAA
jgi:hypothetical protein